jgi:ABC-type microcin C transport system permease subunit YejE
MIPEDDMNPVKQHLARAIDLVNSFGFALIIGAVIYFIIGSVASLVGGAMLDWTFCGSVHRLAGINWCGFGEPSGGSLVRYLLHRLMNVPLPWFMLFWGFVLTAVCSLLLKLLDSEYRPPGRKRSGDDAPE